ncbi:MAG: aminopeptidase [Chloroflexi bacterium]|nr:aminopeptidase [Chloroflexota bacterium]
MLAGARILVTTCTNVQPGEQVLIVADRGTLSIAEVLAQAAGERGAEATLAVMPQRAADSQEPPPTVAAAMKAADVIFTPVSRSITHTAAMKLAVAAGARAAVLTAYTEDLLMSEALRVDFAALAPVCKEVARRLTAARKAHLTTPAGTDLRMDLTGRKANGLTCIVAKGEFSPVPNIEANIVPLEGSPEGVIIADASVPYLGIGVLREPVRLRVQGGRIVSVEGGQQAQVLRQAWESQKDPNAYNIAELGIGLNPKARMTGVMLEDEGVYGSVHIGTGTSITLGGTVKASSHYDLLLWKPTLVLDGVLLLKDGVVADDIAPTALG